jgi:gluconokinase
MLASVMNEQSGKPCSALLKTSGMLFFARTLDKIRLKAAGSLHPDYHENCGGGMDNWCCEFLRVDYGELKARVLEGGTNEEILEWSFERGRRLEKTDLMVWNSFVKKLGWEDFASGFLEKCKAESGFTDRTDILTIPQYFEVDEGRKP